MANSRIESNFAEAEDMRLRGRGPVDRRGERPHGNQRNDFSRPDAHRHDYDAVPHTGWHGGNGNMNGGGGGGGGGRGWNQNHGQQFPPRKRGPQRNDRTQNQPRRFDAGGRGKQDSINVHGEAEKAGGQATAIVAATSANNGLKVEEVEPDSDHTCPVCQNETAYFGVFVCDHAICFACATKLTALCETRACPICRADSPLIYLVRERQRYSTLLQRPYRFRNDRYKLVFEDGEVQAAYLSLLEYRCPVCTRSAGQEVSSSQQNPASDQQVQASSHNQSCVFDTWDQLKAHVRVAHSLFYCEICLAGLKLFSGERKLYNRAELSQHKRNGDADAGYRGHPLCEFCDVRYLDTDELLRHLRKDHFFCHFCDVEGSNEYYTDYAVLLEHFRSAHFVCDEDECATVQFTNVFRTALDLKAHRLSSHAAGMSKAAQKAARQVDVVFGMPRNHFQRRTRDGDDHGASSQADAAASAPSQRENRSGRQNRPPRLAPAVAQSRTEDTEPAAAATADETDVAMPAAAVSALVTSTAATATATVTTSVATTAATVVAARDPRVTSDEAAFPRLNIVPAGPPITTSRRLIVGAWAGRGGNSQAESEWPSLAGPEPSKNDTSTKRKRNDSAKTGVWTVGLPRTGANESPSDRSTLSGWNVRVKVESGNPGAKPDKKQQRPNERRVQQLNDFTTETDSDDAMNSFVRLGRDVTYERLGAASASASVGKGDELRPQSANAASRKQEAADDVDKINRLLPGVSLGSDAAPKRAGNTKRGKRDKADGKAGTAAQTASDAASAAAPPGLTGTQRSGKVAPPPGFDWFDMKPVSGSNEQSNAAVTSTSAITIPSRMFTVRVDDSFTYENGRRLKHALESGQRQTDGENWYVKPPDSVQRNRQLIEAIRRALTCDESMADSAVANSKYDRFKLQSNKFRGRQISATEYLLHCAQIFDGGSSKPNPPPPPPPGVPAWSLSAKDEPVAKQGSDLAELLPELIALLPDVNRQHELLLAALSNDVLHSGGKSVPKSVDLRVAVCEQCGQVCTPKDASYHANEHAKNGALDD